MEQQEKKEKNIFLMIISTWPYQTLVTTASSDKTLAEAVSADWVTLGVAKHSSPMVTLASWWYTAKSGFSNKLLYYW